MKISVASTLFLAASAIAGRSPQHVNKKLPERMRSEPAGLPAVSLDKRAATKKKQHIIPQNKNTTSTYQHSRCSSRPGSTHDDSCCGEAWTIMDNANTMQSMPLMAPRFLTLISILVSNMP
jgi:hypothetical protein